MATELEASRFCCVYQAAWAHDRADDDAKRKSSMAKFYATEAAQRIVDQALQIHGGNGLIAGSIMERLISATCARCGSTKALRRSRSLSLRENCCKATGNRQ